MIRFLILCLLFCSGIAGAMERKPWSKRKKMFVSSMKNLTSKGKEICSTPESEDEKREIKEVGKSHGLISMVCKFKKEAKCAEDYDMYNRAKNDYRQALFLAELALIEKQRNKSYSAKDPQKLACSIWTIKKGVKSLCKDIERVEYSIREQDFYDED